MTTKHKRPKAKLPTKKQLDDLERLLHMWPDHKWHVGENPAEVVDHCPCCGLIATCAQFGPGDGPEDNYATAAIVALHNLGHSLIRAARLGIEQR